MTDSRLPDVDVIIPTRDRLALTTEAVASVVRQTHPGWQAYVVDDAGRADTAAGLRSLCATDPRLHFVVRGEPGGPQAARQTGLEAGSSPWVALLDSDDLWDPARLERQLRHVEARRRSGVDIDAVFARYVWQDERGRVVPSAPPASRTKPWLTNNFATLLVARTVLEAVGGFAPSGRPAMTTCENIELCLRLHGVWRLEVVPDVLARCRVHSGARASDAVAGRRAAAELATVLSWHTDKLAEYPWTWADLEAQVAARYLNAGDASEGVRRLLRAIRRGGRGRGVTIIRRYVPFTLRALARAALHRAHVRHRPVGRSSIVSGSSRHLRPWGQQQPIAERGEGAQPHRLLEP